MPIADIASPRRFQRGGSPKILLDYFVSICIEYRPWLSKMRCGFYD